MALENAKLVRLVADAGGIVVGSAKVELQTPSAAGMLRPALAASVDLAVLEGKRGAGIGSRLMEAGEAWARERGANLMMLDSRRPTTMHPASTRSAGAIDVEGC